MPGGDLANAYTPSFSLLGTESLIMEQSEIGKISTWSRTACAAASANRSARPTSPRQPALQPAQQDPRHLAAGRGLPTRNRPGAAFR